MAVRTPIPPIRSIPPRRELTEEQLADAQARFRTPRSLVQSVIAIGVLTVMAAVIIVPFLYMVLVSLKTPAEVGEGRLLPAGVRSLLERGGRTAWVHVRLTDAQGAALVAAETSGTLYVGPTHVRDFAARPLSAPPEGAVPAHVLARDKPRTGGELITALLEIPDPDGVLTGAPSVAVFMPASAGETWMAVEAQAGERRFRDVVGRLFSNYRELLAWDSSLLHDNRLMLLLHWVSHGYPRWFLNSLFVALVTVLLGVFFDSLAAFAFAKFTFPGRDALFALLLMTVMIPYPVTLVPTFFIFAKLGLYNTYAALIIPGLVSAFGIFLVRQYLQSVPDDMIDAARVDGAGDFMVYRHVILPTARPVLAALAVFRFIFQWNTYLYPLVLTNRDSMKTVQLGLATLEDAHGTVDYGMQMAGAALAVVPVLIVYAFMQKHFISGITMGAVKD